MLKNNIMIFLRSKNNRKKGFTPTPTLASRCFAVIKSMYKSFSPNVFHKESNISQRKTIPKLVSGFIPTPINIGVSSLRERGFTLVEMLVSIAVFMSVMVIAIGSLVSIINSNKKAQSIKSLTDNITFALDSISRNMRVGTDYKCKATDSPDFTFECPNGGKEVMFLDSSENSYTKYRYVDTETASASNMGNIQRIKNCDSGGSSCDPSGWQSLTAPTENVDITNMTFYILGTGTEGAPISERRQPRMIITAQGSITAHDGSKTEFTLQTTASQRARQSSN
jgi:type II secretory pathway pseudopilin PulG